MTTELLERAQEEFGGNGHAEEEAAPPREIDEVEIAALFSADMEPEKASPPGFPGSWFALRPMNRSRFNKWLQGTGATRGDTSALDIDEYQVSLFLNTVVDFHLERKRKHPEAEGGFITEITRPPQTSNSNEWRQGCRAIYDAFTPALGKWLMLECQRVNGMEDAQGKKSEN